MLSSYQIRSKSGGEPGYQTIISYIPELSLSLALIMNGGGDTFYLSDGMLNGSGLISALQTYFTENAVLYSLPPHPDQYVGTYLETSTQKQWEVEAVSLSIAMSALGMLSWGAGVLRDVLR